MNLLGGWTTCPRLRIDEGSLSICRTIIVHGEKDVIAPVEDARQLAQREACFSCDSGCLARGVFHAGFPGLLEDWPR